MTLQFGGTAIYSQSIDKQHENYLYKVLQGKAAISISLCLLQCRQNCRLCTWACQWRPSHVSPLANPAIMVTMLQLVNINQVVTILNGIDAVV